MIRSLGAALLLAGLGLATWSVWLQLDRPVRSVRVEGALSAAERAAIRDVVSGSLEQGVLSLDLAGLERRLRALSWPRSVTVRRLWPDGLVIGVEKESVVAAWGAGGYLNSAGKVVQLADRISGVPTLATALSPPRRAMEVYQMLESRVDAAGLSVVRLEENALGEWLMTLDGGATVALGNESISVRLDRVLAAYRRVLAERMDQVAHVDARYDNGIAVGWKETGTDYALR
ncbi:MAG: FtsQ-type POTRA domain-containing protein [Pseudomonadales bacterium]